MAKLVKRLTDLKIKQGIEPSSYPDGNGLYLQVRKSGAKDWFYRYQVDGKGRKKGLGSYPTVSYLTLGRLPKNVMCYVIKALILSSL